jgi:hypothetical protein
VTSLLQPQEDVLAATEQGRSPLGPFPMRLGDRLFASSTTPGVLPSPSAMSEAETTTDLQDLSLGEPQALQARLLQAHPELARLRLVE